MAVRTPRIAPCLWFDDEAEEAARFYVGIFRDSRIRRTTRYGHVGHDLNGRPEGSVMMVEFEIDGQTFTAMNGGRHFATSDYISFQVICKTQEEVDYFWERLSEGGDPLTQHCGWLKDRFGVSWQVLPEGFTELVCDPDPEAAQRVMRAVLRMEKIQMEAVKRAYAGEREADS